jgi:hypothetical protein
LTRTEIRRYGTFKSHLQLDTPQAVDLMTIRPKHDGDTLRVRWPPDSPDGGARTGISVFGCGDVNLSQSLL